MDEPDSSSGHDGPEPPPSTPAQAAPPPLKTSPWVWVALSLSAVAVLSSVALPVLAILGFMAFDEFGGDSYYVDQRSVVNAVEEPCEAMLDAGSKVSVGRSTRVATASLTNWTEAAQRIVTAIDGAKPNVDSRAWRDDWKATIAAVNTYAKHLGEPRNGLTLPDTAEDIYWNTDAECGLPISIAALDPQYAGSILGE